MTRLTWLKPSGMLGAIGPADIAQAKGALAAWSKSDGASSSPLLDYGLKPEDWDLTKFSTRDKIMLNAFAGWWNKSGYTPVLPIGTGSLGLAELQDSHVSALQKWSTGVVIKPPAPPPQNIPGAPPTAPSSGQPAPPGWPTGVPWPFPKPPGWPATLPFPPLGPLPVNLPPQLSVPPPGWPSGFPFPIPLPQGWQAAPPLPATPPPVVPEVPITPPAQQGPVQPPPQAPAASSTTSSKSSSIGKALLFGGLFVLGGLALFSAAPAVTANPRRQNGPRLNASGEVDEDLADELVLYIDNDQRFSPESPSGRGKAIRDNLLKKFRKGTYDTSRAVDAWMYLVDDAAKAYAKEFQMGSWHHAFTTGTRRLAAFDIEQRVHKSMRLGEYD